LTGVSCRGGEVFLHSYDVEGVGNGISIDAAHGGVQWIGGRISDFTAGVSVNGNVDSIVVQGVTAVNGSVFAAWFAGLANRVALMGNSVSTTRGVSWPSFMVPTAGLTIVGNMFNVSGAVFEGGIGPTAPRVNSKANLGPTGLLSETPIVP
jgi:hypothetical protein